MTELLKPEEIKDRWHIIWDMCWKFITDPADCNELSTNIDSFIEVQLAKEVCPECRICHQKRSSWFKDDKGIICDWCLNDIPYPGKAHKARPDREKMLRELVVNMSLDEQLECKITDYTKQIIALFEEKK